jgi:hypothetical protein
MVQARMGFLSTLVHDWNFTNHIISSRSEYNIRMCRLRVELLNNSSVRLLQITLRKSNHTAINTMAGVDFEYCPEPRLISLHRLGSHLAQRRRNSQEVFDFSKSRISRIYLMVLYNTFLREKVRLWHERYGSNQRYGFKVPKKRKKPFRGESKGSDSNGASRSGLFAAVDYSPRGFRIGNWAVQEVRSRHGDPGPRQGSLERRFVPAPEDRTFFPTLIREDKYEERQLLKRSRKTKVKILQDAQQKVLHGKAG